MASSITRLARGVRPTSPTTGRSPATDDELDRLSHLGQLNVYVLEDARGDPPSRTSPSRRCSVQM